MLLFIVYSLLRYTKLSSNTWILVNMQCESRNIVLVIILLILMIIKVIVKVVLIISVHYVTSEFKTCVTLISQFKIYVSVLKLKKEDMW